MSTLHTFTSYGKSAGSARVRVFDWLEYTGATAQSETYLDTSNNSVSTLLKNPLKTAEAEMQLRKLARRAPLRVLISRQVSPLSTGHLEEKLLSRAEVGVYDFDDALYLDQPGTLAALFPKSRIWTRSVAAADVVIAGNLLLAENAQKLNQNTVVIPSCVQVENYVRKNDYELGQFPRAIWIGSPSTEHYVKGISSALLQLNREYGLRVTLLSAGNNSLGEIDPMIDRVSWTSENYTTCLAEADFGIMPLEDTPWARGKCAYKLLQYGAAGLPLIGSPVGANSDVLSHANGLAPQNSEEWIDALRQIITESTLVRASRGATARRVIEEGYSFASWQHLWTKTVPVASV